MMYKILTIIFKYSGQRRKWNYVKYVMLSMYESMLGISHLYMNKLMLLPKINFGDLSDHIVNRNNWL